MNPQVTVPVGEPVAGASVPLASYASTSRVSSTTDGTSLIVHSGPLGVGLTNMNGSVVVSTVEGAAEEQGVCLGSAVLAVNRNSVQGLDKDGVIQMIKTATRPVTLRFEVVSKV